MLPNVESAASTRAKVGGAPVGARIYDNWGLAMGRTDDAEPFAAAVEAYAALPRFACTIYEPTPRVNSTLLSITDPVKGHPLAPEGSSNAAGGQDGVRGEFGAAIEATLMVPFNIVRIGLFRCSSSDDSGRRARVHMLSRWHVAENPDQGRRGDALAVYGNIATGTLLCCTEAINPTCA